MPLPEPKPGEEKNKFIWRCNKEIEEMEGDKFKTKEQRFAICYKQWKKKNENLNVYKVIEKYLFEDKKEDLKKVIKDYLSGTKRIITKDYLYNKIKIRMDINKRIFNKVFKELKEEGFFKKNKK